MTTTALYQEMAGATGAATVATLLGHPLDTIKTHLQTTTTSSRLSPSSASQIALSLRAGLWRGMGPPLVQAILMNTVMFSVFRSLKLRVGNSTSAGEQAASSWFTSLIAGVGSGVCTACISTPTDYVKIQAQLSGRSSRAILRATLRHRNPMLVFYRGHVANLIREGLFTMVYLGLYDQVSPQGFGPVALTSAGTGAVAWIASYPADTLKTVCQAKGVSPSRALQQIWARTNNDGGTWRRGIGNLYKGCGASTGRAILVTSSRMIVYEWILGRFHDDTPH